MGVQGTQRDRSKNKKIRYLVTAVLICASAAILYTRFRDYTFSVTSNGKECSYTGQKNFAGEMHGSGTLTLSDGTTCSGEWKNSVLLSDGALTFPNGSRYEGEVDEKYLPKGSGTFYYKDEDKAPLSGENWTWIEEKTLDDDQHVINTKNKVFYTGMWLDNQYSGYGCRYTVNSDEYIINRYTGEYRNNHSYGEVTYRWEDYCEITAQYELDGEEDGNPNDTTYSKENVTFQYLNADCASVTGSYQFVENEEITEGIFAGLGIIGGGYRINGELLAGSIYFYNGTDENGNPQYSYYHGTFSGDDIVGKGKFEFVDGTSVDLDNVSWLNSQTRSNGVYTGMISNGEYVGFGIFKKDNGNTYCGEFRDGNFNGMGTYAQDNANGHHQYEGSWVNGILEGEGKHKHYHEDRTLCCTFNGQFKNKEYSDGTYEQFFLNGNLAYRYTGTYDENGDRSGNDCKYESYYEEGYLHCTYNGSWKNGTKSDGTYEQYYENGNLNFRYTGTYDENSKHSGNDCKLEYYNEDGTLYSIYNGQYTAGEFSDGTYERYYENGNLDYRYTGTYDENGKFSGNDCKCEKYNENGTLLFIYEGNYKNDKKNGYGTFTWNNSDFYRQYSGNFVDDEYEGEGTLYWISGAVYTGGWHNGTYHGFGTYTFPDGSLLTGQWINGEFQD